MRSRSSHAPLPVKERDCVNGEETGESRVLFKTVFVFDREQVAPIDGVEQAPLQPPSQPLTGDSHAHLIAPLRILIHETVHGMGVGYELFGRERAE